MNYEKGQILEPMNAGTITKDLIRKYAEASGDFNPIHLDDEAAKKSGLPGVIAHGMLLSAFVAERAMRFFGEETDKNWRFVQFDTRFKNMTLPGEVISVGGSIRDFKDDLLTLELSARNESGEVKTLGTLKLKRLESPANPIES